MSVVARYLISGYRCSDNMLLKFALDIFVHYSIQIEGRVVITPPFLDANTCYYQKG